MRGTAIPMFDRHGTALSQEARGELARKNGVCVKCGILTHDVKVFRRVPLTNEHVYAGKCIMCHPGDCPHEIVQAWEQKFKPRHTGMQAFVQNSSTRSSATTRKQFTTSSTRRGLKPTSKSKSPPPPAQRLDRRTSDITESFENSSDLRNLSSDDFGNRAQDFGNHSQDFGDYSHAQQLRRVDKSNPDFKNKSASRRNPSSLSTSKTSRSFISNKPETVNRIVSAGNYIGDGLQEDAETLAKSLKINISKPDVLKQKLHKLRNLGEECGTLYLIKELMERYQNSSIMLEVCCGVIWGITAKDDNKKVLAAETGTINTIVDIFQNSFCESNSNLVQWVIGSLSCLSRGSGNRQRIADVGAIEKMLDCMKKLSTSAGVFEWTCRTLYSLIHKYEEELNNESIAIQKNIISIEEHNGIQIVISAMKNYHNEANAQMWAIKVLWRLQDREDEAVSIRVLRNMDKAGGVSACVKVLRARSTTSLLFEATIVLLLNIISATQSNDVPLFNDEPDCIALVVRKMKEEYQNASFQEACCNLLAVIVSRNRAQFKESEGLREVVAALMNFSDNLPLCCAAINVLWTVSYRSTYFDQVNLVNSVSAVIIAHKKNPGNVQLLGPSCAFLANVLASSSARLDKIPIVIPFNALLLKSEDLILCNQAARVMSNMYIKYPSLLKTGFKSKHINSLVDCLGASSSDYLHAVYDVLTKLGILSDNYKIEILRAGCLKTAKSYIQSSRQGTLNQKVLRLISVLTSSQARAPIEMPNDIFLVLMSLKISSPGLLGQSCEVLRDLLASAIPGSKSLNFEGLVEFGCTIINDSHRSIKLKERACEVLWAFTAKQECSIKNLSLMYSSLLNLMSLYKGEQHPYESDLQSAAAGALASVTACMREADVELEMKDLEEFIHTIYTIMERDLNRTELLLKLLDSLLNLSILNELMVIQCGGVVVAIDIMVEHEHAESVQERGCSILAVLSSTENLQVNLCIAETDGVDMIISALATFSSNERIQVGACKTLSHLSVDVESRLLISSFGGVMLILNAMKSNKDNVDLLEGACMALLNLSSDAEDEVLSDPSVIETIVSFMHRHLDARRLQEAGLGILQNISMRKEDAKRRIAQAGGIDTAIKAIKDNMGAALVVERALTTLWSLAIYESNQIAIANAGGIDMVVNGMMAQITNAKVQQQASGCLCTLSLNSRNKTLIREAGGVDAIVYAMWAHFESEVVQAEACRALSNLALNVATQEVMIATDGEINNIIAAMRRFPDSEKCQEYSCLALRNFMLSVDNMVLIKSNLNELIGLLSHAAQRFPTKCSERANQMLEELQRS
eukprot:CAMPEP_0194151706 /NCGR_PEP_ID=MMETSP0152-20130528/49368_1 /TAXON_ID=1049557 /ORGANISM="Thalassiothrix antarctica, Strain L6-D1" /LENGTH=1314 /DNA_ID=CAMNT_0038855743 /DNA_START=114 /DNA_END=4058 /DNA_ORIENTATION=+